MRPMADYSTRDIKRYKTVTDLRTQYMCEYRLFLRTMFGVTSTKASRQGTRLHSGITIKYSPPSKTNIPLLLIVGILTIIAAIFWMLG